jgi:hypothetical protein
MFQNNYKSHIQPKTLLRLCAVDRKKFFASTCTKICCLDLLILELITKPTQNIVDR